MEITMEKKRAVKEFIIYAVIFIVLVAVIPRFVMGTTVIEGHSMEDTLEPGDWLINQKVSYYFKEPQRFDVVLFWSPHDDTEQWVKRVIGLPGEVIQIKEGRVFIDGQVLEGDTYGNGPVDYAGVAKEPYTIPEDCYFVIGDNRWENISWDSRYAENGAIPRESMIGRVLLRTWPLNRAGFIK